MSLQRAVLVGGGFGTPLKGGSTTATDCRTCSQLVFVGETTTIHFVFWKGLKLALIMAMTEHATLEAKIG